MTLQAEAATLIIRRREARQDAAIRLRNLRAISRPATRMLRGLLHTPAKPTARNLLAEADGLARFARTPIIDHSTEYYSTCGDSDGQFMMRESAAEFASFLRQAAKLA